MSKSKIKGVFSKYLFAILVGVTALVIAPTYGYTSYMENKAEEERIEKENALLQEYLESLRQEQENNNCDDNNGNGDLVVENDNNQSGSDRNEDEGDSSEEDTDEGEDSNTDSGNNGNNGEANGDTNGSNSDSSNSDSSNSGSNNSGNNGTTGSGNSGNSGSTNNGAGNSGTAGSDSHLSFDIVYTEPPERTLFIGDSRTEGFVAFSKLDKAKLESFATTGCSVYQMWDLTAEVNGKGSISLQQLLEEETYENIHILLGINEIGRPLDETIQTYSAFVTRIRALQPNAHIYISANFHLGPQRNDPNSAFSNVRIDYLNEGLKKLADNQTIFYVDPNELFDDSNGNMDSIFTNDGVHLVYKYYIPWAQWLMEQFLKH